MQTFAAIVIGSYEITMKIFEFSKKNTMKELTYLRHSVELGRYTYETGRADGETLGDLCKILNDFMKKMKEYGVTEYIASGTSAVRALENAAVFLDQIRNRTQMSINVLGNSEQRFLDFKSIAAQGRDFDKMLENGAIILDIGGGSTQISVFNDKRLVTTQNLNYGILKNAGDTKAVKPKEQPCGTVGNRFDRHGNTDVCRYSP